ncbi:perlucin-like isoform X1 [Mytilus galloprovincialis]|uniref:perlucin-like isoform X1 n=1 Tax=Mytilus galloprovincialis TaxID=29158 RepID=UPI003F7C6E0F
MDFRVILFVGISISCVQSECHRGWFHYGNSCYFFSHTLKTWGDAANFCRTYNSHLATVETGGENAFLTDTIELIKNGIGKRDIDNSDFWLGGTDEVIEGVWVWAPTGKDLTYTNWFPGDPDNWETGENCLELSWLLGTHGTWNDQKCSIESHFICETEFPASGSIIG